MISGSLQGEVTPLLEAVSRRLPDLLREARELADYVIVDTPPLGQVSDALRAATVVDDIILVTRPGNTDRIELQHTRELLDRMGHTPTGLLVIGEPGIGDVYAGYGESAPAEPNGRPATATIVSPLVERDAAKQAGGGARPGRRR